MTTDRFKDRIASLPTMEHGDILALKGEIEDDLATRRADFDLKRRAAAADGRYLDPRWYSATEAAIRFLGRQSQRVQTELAYRRQKRREKSDVEDAQKRIRKAKEAANGKTFEARFVDAAQLMLPARLFRDISRAASGVIPVVEHPERENVESVS